MKLHLSDLVTGIVAALALKGLAALPPRFDRALAQVLLNDLPHEAKLRGLTPRFRVVPHPIHGDSRVVQTAVCDAIQRGLLSRSLYLRITKQEALSYFKGLPGDVSMYEALGAKILTTATTLGTQSGVS